MKTIFQYRIPNSCLPKDTPHSPAKISQVDFKKREHDNQQKKNDNFSSGEHHLHSTCKPQAHKGDLNYTLSGVWSKKLRVNGASNKSMKKNAASSLHLISNKKPPTISL